MALLRSFWRLLVGIKDGLALLFLLMILLAILAARQEVAPVSVPGGSALVLDLKGYIVDQAHDPDPFRVFMGGPRIPGEVEVRDVVRAIDGAARDKRIKSLVLDLDGFWGGGLANLQAVGDALTRFRAAGKPVYAFSSAYLDDGYYLASFANEVWLTPLGAVLLTGPGGSNLYFKNALDKLKVDVNVFRVGEFKSAVEPFTRSEASEPARKANQALVDDLWETWLNDVDAQRPNAHVGDYMTSLPKLLDASSGEFAQAALKGGLVDKIGTRVAFGEAMQKIVGKAADDNAPGSFNGVPLRRYSRVVQGQSKASGDAVGIVYVAGEIIDGEAPAGTAGGDTISGLINDAVQDDSIKALVVRIDSPGGSVTASEKIRQALATAKAEGLPVVASFGPVAASGGYWVSTAADEVFAEPSTITGSIGVFAIIPTFEQTLAEIGVNADGVKSTPFSGAPDVFDGLTPEVRQLFQASVEDIYRRFTRLVASARDLPVSRVDEIGQGHVWSGGAAHQLKLVDHLGGLDEAVAAAARRAGLKPEGVRTVDIELEPPLTLQLLSSLFEPEESQAAPSEALGRLAARDRMRALAGIGEAAEIAAGATVQARCLECMGVALAPARPSDVQSWLKLFLK